MEKCTYCVQRINAARVAAGRENRPIRAGDIETACQAACPTQAIAFGNLNDPDSPVVRWKRSPLNYGLLEDLNTQPRTSYLAMISNPNPAIEEGAQS
jgi:molybdopterin-containing oxidoreductase family iron-sulfur binding subunit